MKLNSVDLEIIRHKFAAISDEMWLTLKRTARSIYVREGEDFSTGMVDLQGHMFACPAKPSITSIERNCRPSIERVGPVEPGDVIVTNDPYQSGGLATHIPDIHMLRPFFYEGQIVCYGWCFAHFMDMGGRVPSSISPSNSEVMQEGLRIPPSKFARCGVIDETLLGVIAANCRTPEQNVADLRAMAGALEVGQQRLVKLIERHGLETVIAAQAELQEYAAAKSRAALRQIPDGEYDFWDFMDDDLVTRIPLRFRVRMTVKDGEVALDCSDTDPQVRSAYNLTTHGDNHPWLFARLVQFVLSQDPSIPLNAGIYRPMQSRNQKGSVLFAEYPDPVGVRHSVAYRFNDTVMGALVKAAPGLMSAPTSGASIPVVLAEAPDDSGRRNISVIEPLTGGRGAYDGGDGVDARDNSAANMGNHPIEIVEKEASTLILRYDIRPDSGGAGKWRGGVGLTFKMEIRRDNSNLLARSMERMRFVPWGYSGGKPALPLRVIVNEGRPDERELGKIDTLTLNAGDTVTFLTPGGGGFGDPLDRDVEAVRRDVRLGFVTPEGALRDYGVVFALDGTVDTAATEIARAACRRAPGNERTLFAFGEERIAWEAVFDDDMMHLLNTSLYRLPKPQRQPTRERIFYEVTPELGQEERVRFHEVLADPDARRARLRQAIAGLGQA